MTSPITTHVTCITHVIVELLVSKTDTILLTGPRPILKLSTKAMMATELGIAQPLFVDIARQKADIDIKPAESTNNCLGLYF
jgi:hypothetical protein